MAPGDLVMLVSRKFNRTIWVGPRKIERETACFWWVGQNRYHKPTGTAFRDYMHEDRAIVPFQATAKETPATSKDIDMGITGIVGTDADGNQIIGPMKARLL